MYVRMIVAGHMTLFMCSHTTLFTCVFRYCLVREAKKPSFVRLDQNFEELKTSTKFICEVCGVFLT